MKVKRITTLLAIALGVSLGIHVLESLKLLKTKIISQKEWLLLFDEIDQGESDTDDDLIKVVIAEGKAYWIEDGHILVAPVDEDDEIDTDNVVEYNAIDAPRNELTKIMLILDNLKEDT